MQDVHAAVTPSKSACVRSACTSYAMLDAGLTMTEDSQCSDHVVVGTKAGDCLFLDAEHDGQVMLCFPAHRSAHHHCCACQSFAQPCSHEWCMHCLCSSQASIRQQDALLL